MVKKSNQKKQEVISSSQICTETLKNILFAFEKAPAYQVIKKLKMVRIICDSTQCIPLHAAMVSE